MPTIEELETQQAALNEEMKQGIAAIREAIDSGATKADIEEVKAKLAAEMEALEVKLTRPNTNSASGTGTAGADEFEAKSLFIEWMKTGDESKRQAAYAKSPRFAEEFKTGPTALDTGTTGDGGALILPELYDQIIRNLFLMNDIRADSLNLRTNFGEMDVALSQSADWGGGWVSEQSVGDDATTLGRATTNATQFIDNKIPVYEVYALPMASNRFLQTSRINNIEGWLIQQTSDKINELEGTAFITGNGATQPQGLLNATNGVSRVTTPTGNITGASVAETDILSTAYSLRPQYLKKAKWYLHRSLMGHIASLKSSTGLYYFMPNLASTEPGTLLGYDIEFCESMPTYASIVAGTNIVVFGDLSQGYCIVDGATLTIIRDPYTHKGWVLFYASKFVGGKVVKPEALSIMAMAAD